MLLSVKDAVRRFALAHEVQRPSIKRDLARVAFEVLLEQQLHIEPHHFEEGSLSCPEAQKSKLIAYSIIREGVCV